MMYTIVIPIYNAGAFIEETIRDVVRVFSGAAEPWEIIAVNDGSTDTTAAALERMAKETPGLRVVHMEVNGGKGRALRRGMREARGECVAFTDADLPYGAPALVSLLERMKEDPSLQFVYGSRSHASSVERRGYGLLRRIGRLFFSVVVRALAAPGVQDTQCGIKALRRPFLLRVLEVSRVDRFAFDVELFAIARAAGAASLAMPVSLNHRKESSVRLVTDTARMLRDIWRIRRNVKRRLYAKAPNHLIT